MEKEEKVVKEKSSKFRILMGVFITGLVTIIAIQGVSMIMHPRKIAYPVDILVDSPAPLYQANFPLEDAIFSSNFESGNLRTVVKAAEGVYKLEIGEDCTNMTRFNNKNWFYFSIENLGPTRLITVQIENMAYNWSMWKNGIAPVYRSAYTNWKWAFLDHFPLEMRLKKDSLQVAFKYRLRASEKVFIALSFPWSYSTDRHFYARLEAKHQNSQRLYFEKEILAKTLQGRRVHMITITGKNATKTETEHFPQLGVKSHLFLGREKSNTKFFPNKKYIVLSARVHPSEVASSYVLRALVKYLLKPRIKEIQQFLENFVVVIIPMLNPDGVANGYTRLDTNGLNLNAYYKYANKRTPTIYALKRLMKYLSDRKVLHAYIDLHAHTTKRGIFFFANPLNHLNYKETLEIPYLFYDYQKEFTFTRSRFGVEKGESTSRKEFFKLTKCNRLYVLETNYWGETFTLKQLKARKLVKDNLRFVKNFGRFYSLEKFAEIGTNLAKTIVSAGLIEILRQDKRNQKHINVFDQELNQMFKILSSKSERRKLKKLIKKQAARYNHTELFTNEFPATRNLPAGSSKDKDSEKIPLKSVKNSSKPYPRSDAHDYDEELLLNEEDKLHNEESFKGQDPVR